MRRHSRPPLRGQTLCTPCPADIHAAARLYDRQLQRSGDAPALADAPACSIALGNADCHCSDAESLLSDAVDHPDSSPSPPSFGSTCCTCSPCWALQHCPDLPLPSPGCLAPPPAHACMLSGTSPWASLIESAAAPQLPPSPHTVPQRIGALRCPAPPPPCLPASAPDSGELWPQSPTALTACIPLPAALLRDDRLFGPSSEDSPVSVERHTAAAGCSGLRAGLIVSHANCGAAEEAVSRALAVAARGAGLCATSCACSMPGGSRRDGSAAAGGRRAGAAAGVVLCCVLSCMKASQSCGWGLQGLDAGVASRLPLLSMTPTRMLPDSACPGAAESWCGS